MPFAAFRIRHPLIWFLSLICLAAPAATPAQCPQSSVSCVGTYLGNVVFDVSETSTSPTAAVTRGDASASYSLPDGVIRAVMWVDIDDTFQQTSRATAVDRFEVHGAAVAWVTIRLNLDMIGSTDTARRLAGSDVTARITARDQTASVTTQSTTMPVPFIWISAYLVYGEPLEVTYEVIADGWGYEPMASIVCQLEFLGLPEGATITSCNGFTTSPTVSTEKTTWGGIKAMYR